MGVSASAELSDEIAYLIAKTMVEQQNDLINGHVSFKMFDPKTAWKPGKIGAPLHPGAERYYRERGWIH